MENAFNDERINRGRGRAFRKAIWFAFIFTLIYTAAVVITDIACNRFVIFEITVQVLTIIGGGLILLWGELAYIGASSDEMRAHKRNTYYSKAFYGFVFAFAFAYCVHIAVNFRYVGMPKSFPHGFYPAAMLECVGLYLMFCLKRERVMLNHTQIEGGGKRYYLRVLLNILKLGGLCAAFTVFAAMLFVFLGGELVSYLGLGVLLGGAATWLTLSAEYFVLSLMERASEKAGQRGRLSVTILVYFLLAVLVYVCLAAMSIYLCYFEEINSAQTALFYSYFNIYASWLAGLSVTFFAIYIWAESEPLKLSAAARKGEGLIKLLIAQLCVSIFDAVLSSLISAGAPSLESEVLRIAIASYLSLAVTVIFSVMTLAYLVPILREAGRKKLISLALLPAVVIYTGLYIFMSFLTVLLSSQAPAMANYLITAVAYVFCGGFVLKLWRNIRFSAES